VSRAWEIYAARRSSPTSSPYGSGRRPVGLLVVVDMCLTLMLLGGILVGLVGMGQGGVIVLVVMVGGEVGPLLPMSQVVGHVRVFVLVHLGLVAMLLC
jgi:hypothetical protein